MRSLVFVPLALLNVINLQPAIFTANALTLPQFAVATTFVKAFKSWEAAPSYAEEYQNVDALGWPSIPTPTQIWESMVNGAVSRVRAFAENERHEFAEAHPEVAQKLADFQHNFEDAVQRTSEFFNEFHNLDRAEWSEQFSMALNATYTEMQEEFPPLTNASRHEERARFIGLTMEKVEHQIASTLSSRLDLPISDVRSRFSPIRTAIESVVVTTGDIAELHPIVVEMLLFSGAVLLIPEAFILRPLLSLFGFSPLGPVKGTTAAWAQRYFFGAAVKQGSWFARLQSAGMKVGSETVLKWIVSIALAVGGSLTFCVRR